MGSSSSAASTLTWNSVSAVTPLSDESSAACVFLSALRLVELTRFSLADFLCLRSVECCVSFFFFLVVVCLFVFNK